MLQNVTSSLIQTLAHALFTSLTTLILLSKKSISSHQYNLKQTKDFHSNVKKLDHLSCNKANWYSKTLMYGNG